MQPGTDTQPSAGPAAASAARPLDHAAAAAAGKKPKRRQDRAALDKVLHQLHDSPIMCMLLEQQQRVDDLTQQRRDAVRDALGRPERMRTRVRLTITHTQQTSASASSPPSWCLVIHGRTLDTVDVTSSSTTTQIAHAPTQHLTTAMDAAIAKAGRDISGKLQQLAQAVGTNPVAALTAATTGLQTASATAPTLKQPLTAYIKHIKIVLTPLVASTSGLPSNATTAAPAVTATATASAGGVGDVSGKSLEARGPPQSGPTIDADDAAAAPGARVLTWDRSRHVGPHKDCIEVRFQGVGEFARGARASITLTLDNSPERFVIPSPLADALGTALETKPQTLKLLRDYLKRERLLDRDQSVTLNSILAQTLNISEEATISFQKLQTLLVPKLTLPSPLRVHHTIGPVKSTFSTLAAPSSSVASVFDIECDTLGPLNPNTEKPAQALLEKHSTDRDVDAVETEMLIVLRRLAEHRRRRAILMGFAQSPVDFTAALLATQAKDVRVTKGTSLVPIAEALSQGGLGLLRPAVTPALVAQVATGAATVAKEFEAQRYTELFKGKWVEDAAVAYLARTHNSRPPAI